MARKTIEIAACDKCAKDERQGVVIVVPIERMDGTFARIDLCAAHYRAFLQQLADLVLIDQDWQRNRLPDVATTLARYVPFDTLRSITGGYIDIAIEGVGR